MEGYKPICILHLSHIWWWWLEDLDLGLSITKSGAHIGFLTIFIFKSSYSNIQKGLNSFNASSVLVVLTGVSERKGRIWGHVRPHSQVPELPLTRRRSLCAASRSHPGFEYLAFFLISFYNGLAMTGVGLSLFSAFFLRTIIWRL